MAFNAVEPRSVCWCVDQLHMVLFGPCFHFFMVVGRKIIQNNIQAFAPVKTATQHLKKAQKILVTLGFLVVGARPRPF